MYTAAALIIAAAALDFLGRLLFPRMTILKLPPGVVASLGDTGADWGNLAMRQNLNSYSITPTPPVATAGTNVTLTPAQATNGALILTPGASGAFTITLPSTAAMLTAMGPTIPTDGTYGELLFIQNNNVGQTGTLTAGDASTTLSGNLTVATNTTRVFFITVTGPGVLTIINVGTFAL